MVFDKKIMKELKKRKEPMLIGAVVGFIAAAYTINQGYDLVSIATAGKGVLDTLMSRSAPLEVAVYKVYGLFIFVGTTLGFFVDYGLDYFKIGKKKRRRRKR